MTKCQQCDRTVKNPGQYELLGHQLCSARCHGLYSKLIRWVNR